MLCSEPHGYRTATVSWKFHIYSHQFASRNADVCVYWDLLKYLFNQERPSSHKLTRNPRLDLPPLGIGCQGGLRMIESIHEQLRSTPQRHPEDVSTPIGDAPTYD